MVEYIKIFLFIIIPMGCSSYIGTYSYCSFLFGKYGKAEKYYERFLVKNHEKKRKRMWKENPSEKELKKIIKQNSYYDRVEENAKKIKILGSCLTSRRFKSKEEKEFYYPKDRPRRKRFDFFMILTRINYIITGIVAIIVMILMISNTLSYNELKIILMIKSIFIDVFCIACCIPFGYFDAITNQENKGANIGWRG